MINLGYVPVNATIRIPWDSADVAGASVTVTGFAAGDLQVYKDGSTTQRSSTSGFTATTDFDGATGCHLAILDLSDNADAGFYASGSEYLVMVNAVTVEGQTVRFWLARFTIGVQPANTTQFGGSNITSASGIPEVKVQSIANDAITANAIQNNAITAAKIADGAIDAATFAAGAIDASAIAANAIGASELATDAAAEIASAVRTELATELGRVDAAVSTRASQTSVDTIDGIVDDILVDTGTTLQGEVDGIQADTEDIQSKIGTPAGASVSADIAAVKTDTGNLVTRITSTLFAGITSLAEWLGLLAGKQTGNTTARNELRATGAGSGTYDETTDALQAIRDRGDAAWADSGTPPSAASIADAVWEEAIADHSGTSGSTAEALSDAGGAGTPPTAEEVAAAVWDEARADHVGAGSFGQGVASVQGNVTGSVASVTAGVSLADDAITAAKFDESTAFPLKSADTGSTQIARVGADGDTLETLSDQLDAKASQVSVDDLPTNAELSTALGTADDAVLAAIGALSIPTANQNATAVVNAASATPLAANVKQVNDVDLQGDGTSGNPWQPA